MTASESTHQTELSARLAAAEEQLRSERERRIAAEHEALRERDRYLGQLAALGRAEWEVNQLRKRLETVEGSLRYRIGTSIVRTVRRAGITPSRYAALSERRKGHEPTGEPSDD